MRKLDGKDPKTWIFHMEQFFDIHQVTTLQKVNLASMCFEPNQLVWYQWICEQKKNYIVYGSIFTNELIEHLWGY
jgi:hypothetical protein